MISSGDNNGNAICFAADRSREAIQQAVSCYSDPFAVYKPKIFRDGNQWCALLGDIATGVCGFGDSPAKAAAAFDKAWYESITKQHGGVE